MASTAISPETQAIVDILKHEGELIRNRGVNSVRSLSIKLDKFDGLFSSINKNMTEQTALLERQIGLSDRADARLANQEQFDELERKEAPPSVDTSAKDKKGRDDTNINKMGDAIGKAFTMQSLKNVAMLAGGAFIGYNLIKGAIDERTGGGFSALESNIGSFARGLGDIDFTEMRQTFDTLTASISGIAASLTSLTAILDKIMSINWETIIDGVLRSIGLLTAYNLTMKAAIMLMGGNALFGGKRRFFRALLGAGVGVATLNSLVDTDADRAKVTEVDANRRGNLTPDQRAALSGTGAYAVETAPRVASTTPRQPNYTWDPDSDIYRGRDGNILHGNARTASENARLRSLQPSALNMPTPTSPRAISMPKAAVPNPRAIADAFLEANKRQITMKAAKKVPLAIAKTFPVVGELLGLGFMIWSISKGDFTSATLEGASLGLPSLVGLPADLAAVGTSIYHEITGENYLNTAQQRPIMYGIMGMVWEAYIKYLEDKDQERKRAFDALPENERAAITAENEYLAAGGRPGGRLGERGNTSIGSMLMGSYNGAPENTLNQSPYFRGNYFTGNDGDLYFQPSPLNGGGMATRIGKINELSAGTNAPLTLVNAQQGPVTVNTVQGAQTQNSLAVVGGGSTMAFTASGLPYFTN